MEIKYEGRRESGTARRSLVKLMENLRWLGACELLLVRFFRLLISADDNMIRTPLDVWGMHGGRSAACV